MSKRKKKKTRRKSSPAPQRKISPTLSLCMIVKNEEEYLLQCLNSVKSIVDEMVIVDTGSTDRTVEIAESFGAKVLHHTWNNDFAEARNVSLQHATCNWILVLDADEVIEERDLAGLRNICGSGKFKAYSVVTRNYNNDSKGATWVPNDGQCEKAKEFTGWSPSSKVRLFRNNKAIRFSGIVHELVEPSIREKGWNTGVCDVPVHHFGRARQEDDQEAKGQFYFKLIQKTASEENQNPDAYFKRGAQGADLGYHEEAVMDFYRVKELAPSFPRIDSNLSASLVHLERYDEAIGVLKDGIEKGPGDAGLWNNLGLAYYAKGIYDVAVENLEKAVRLKPDYAAAYKNLGMAYAQAGRIKDAISAFTKALKLNPTLVEIKKTLEKLKEMENFNLRSPASPTLSLCMIVKNEEKYLPQCLESVKSIVDEMVIVDTGSTDRTAEIAESFGAKMFHHPWNNDFAEARNVSLRHATCDWILVLDADEVIALQDLPKIKTLIRNKDAAGYILVTRTYQNSSTLSEWQGVEHPCPEAKGYAGYIPSPHVRLFRRDKEIYFEGKVHEIVEYAISRKGGKIVETDIPIHHYGYISDKDSVKQKEKLYRRLIEEAETGKEPGDARSYLYKGITCIELKMYDKAEKFLNKAAAMAPENTMILFNLGLCAAAQDRTSEAIKFYNLVLKYDSKHAGAYNNLAEILEKKGRTEEVETLYHEALKHNPNHYIICYNLGTFLKNQGRDDEAIKEFQKVLSINPEMVEAHFSSGILFFKKGDYRKSAICFKQALEIDPSHETARKNLDVLKQMGIF
jgi:glycosyltransferase involved in cell wall biosynthesis